MDNIIKFPGNDDDFYKIGLKKQNQQSYEEAISYYQKSLQKENKWQVVQSLAECYQLIGRYDDAEQTLIQYLTTHFDSSDVFYELSRLFIRKRDPNKAFLFGMYYSLNTDDEHYLEEMRTLFDVFYDDQSKMEEESESFVVHYIFQHFFQTVNYELALDWINYQPVDIQSRAEIRNLKAMTLLFIGEYKESSAILEQLLAEDATDIHALCHYTLLLYNTNQTEQYEQYLKRLEKIVPLNDDEKFKLGIVLSFLNKFEESHELLFPLYKKGKFLNQQMYHALSFNSFALGQFKQSDQFWESLTELVPQPGLSPRRIYEGHQYLTEVIIPLIDAADRNHRLIGIFLISQMEDKTMLINRKVWERLEQLPDFEKLYLSYIFHDLNLIKLDFIHKGLERLNRIVYDIELFDYWIEKAESIIEAKMDLKHVNAYVAVCYFLYMRLTNDKITKREVIEKFNTTRYHFIKVYNGFKQNNI
ncbi:tetratricopeptide repeat protein [Macrococcus capreoli]|uniref:tetratricopeptide repeat protein n=1 Tax=Macrococcus capreoli TaxID=2982690 RepID=UPI0021D57B7A|nr:tetratricopeptide repeat protein [Macrococcus sp. TMW 2.2395]MCU7556320.1 tetratricopeptide repeat protein [Macrococcus sp. TMW 2.2395]